MVEADAGSKQLITPAAILRVDVDIGSSAVANGVLGLVFGFVTTLVVDMAFLIQTDDILQLSKQIKEKMIEVDAFGFEGRTDDKIKLQEVVEELRAKRADMQMVV